MFNKIQNSKFKIQNLFFVFCFIFSSIATNAQCAMCRAALGGDANRSQAQAVNDGIVYLMAVPYLLVAILGFIIFRMWRKREI